MSLEALLELAAKDLGESLTKPDIRNYGAKPYPEQMRFHECQKPGRYISGGNRAGKTDAIVVEAIRWASGVHPKRFTENITRPMKWGYGPLNLRFVAVDVSKGVEQILLPKFKRWMSRSMMVGGSWNKSWNSKDMILTFANGSTIDFVTHGMDLSKLGGVPRHIIFFDEIPPIHIFNESMERLVDYEGWWVIAATSVDGIGWTHELLWEPYEDKQDDPECMIGLFTLRQSDNPYLEASKKHRSFYAAAMSEEEQLIRHEGEFVARSGLVFPEFSKNTEAFIADPFPDGIPPSTWGLYMSIDSGWKNPTAVLWTAVSPSGEMITFAEHYQSLMTVREHAQVIKRMEARMLRQPDMRTGDPALKQTKELTGTNVIQEYALNGIYIAVDGVPRQVEPGLAKMQQYFRLREDGKPTWRVTRDCPNLIRELKKLHWASYESEKRNFDTNPREEIHKKDDHAFDSLRYLMTLMPDLSPQTNFVRHAGQKKHLSYAEIMLMRREDPDTVFAVDENTNWNTQMLAEDDTFDAVYEDLYGGL